MNRKMINPTSLFCLLLMMPLFSAPAVAQVPEPGIDSSVVVAPQTPGEPVWGWANVHEHQFANLAYGGAMFWGAPFSNSDTSDDDDVNEALAWCDYTDDFTTWFGWDREDLLGRGYEVHGDLLIQVIPFAGGFTNNISTGTYPDAHRVGGSPAFDGWPGYLQGGHQQMYYKWLERAYAGGLRLMVNLAVNNEVLCELSYRRKDDGGVWPCHDMNNPDQEAAGVKSTVDRQIDGMYALQEYIDGKCEGEECGWYRIATSASQARKIIEGGKMAIIIGIEVDSLFGCKPDSDFCTEDYINSEIVRYKAKGVSYIFPVHAFDNKFAGPDLYSDFFVLANYLATDGQIESWDCSIEGYTYKLLKPKPAQTFPEWLDEIKKGALFDLYGAILLTTGDVFGWLAEIFSQTAQCNVRGLTAEGEILIAQLIAHDMMIDIDHISYRALHGYGNGDGGEPAGPYHPGIFDIAAMQLRDDGHSYQYPVVSGHAGVYQPWSHPATEGSLTKAEAETIIGLGGVVSLPLPHGKCQTSREFLNPKSPKEGGDWLWLLGYKQLLAIQTDYDHPRISLGGDFGSFNPQTAPRYELDGACDYTNNENSNNDGSECEYANLFCKDSYINDPEDALRYPFDAFGVGGGQFWAQKTGDRTFDFNTQGLAHVGMYPDFLADLVKVGLTREELGPLFGSAEGFLGMWEEIENCTPDTTAPVPDQTSLPDSGGECSAGVTVTPSATDFCAGPITGTTTDPLSYTEQGTHTITWNYDDGNGNVATQTQTVIVDDITAPVIESLVASPDILQPVNHKMVSVTITAVSSDNCDSSPWCRITEVSSNEPDEGQDWQIAGDLDIELRSERLGTGSGRVYTNEVTCSDYAENDTVDYVDVVVPHDKSEND